MAHVVVFHSVLGLRAVELEAADRLRDAGHETFAPHLFAGQTSSTVDDVSR